MTRATVASRFWARVDSSAGLTACWPWTGNRSDLGYGRLTVNRARLYAHRVALELNLGRPIAPGLFACHTCDNPPCCNPLHLFEGDQAANMADAVAKGRRQRGRLTPEQVMAIRSAGLSANVLADWFGVSVRTIYRALDSQYRPAVTL